MLYEVITELEKQGFPVLVSVRPDLWFLGLGALVNTLMFLFISIPMAETRIVITSYSIHYTKLYEWEGLHVR